MTEDQFNTEPVQDEPAAPPEQEESHDYRDVEEGVKARVMTDEERESRS